MTATIFHLINYCLSVKQYCYWTITHDAVEEIELIGKQMRKTQAVKNIHSMLAALKSEKKSEWLQILNAYFPTVTQHLLIPENTK